MNMIQFNYKMIIDHLEYIDEIYIVCKSYQNSLFIKNKYFRSIDRIKVSENLQFSNLNYGYNIIPFNKNKNISIHIIGSDSFNFYSIMRITQTILGFIIILFSIIIYIQFQKKYLSNKIQLIPLIILFLFGLMALINGLTSTCSMSIILKNYLN
jgi:hypothetical protein